MKNFFFPIAIVALIVLCIGAYISINNGFINSEEQVSAFNKDSENHLSNYTLKVQEAAQVPAMYKKDLQDVITKTFEGRYGADGSKAVMQWIQEQNIPLDSSLYKEIQVIIKSGRDEFRISQTKKLDACRIYKRDLRAFPGNLVANIGGYPHIDLEATCRVVSDANTQAAFAAGTQTALKIGG